MSQQRATNPTGDRNDAAGEKCVHIAHSEADCDSSPDFLGGICIRRDQGDPPAARALLVRAVTVLERVPGQEHPLTGEARQDHDSLG